MSPAVGVGVAVIGVLAVLALAILWWEFRRRH